MIYLNDKQIQPTHFPDGTSQVWKIAIPNVIAHIEWKFQAEHEFMYLAQLVDLIRYSSNCKITLHMDYLPYARQDKAIKNDATFALQTFANLINSLNFDKVTFLDAHSDAAEYLIRNSHNIFPHYEIRQALGHINPDIICFPDKGARDRYSKALSTTGKIYIHGDKVRDQQTGNILSYALTHGELVKDKSVLIVDDICDGGGTFVLLSKELLTNGAKAVNLYTTHGIYSKGLKPLREAKVNRIFNKDGEVGELQGQIVIKKF